ncbi:MAG TPA: DUF6644 family protein [Hyphomonadaceae bacterium]|nr:DUF6644 family protein [Hyphomonadaceae bacterium]
MNFHSIFPDLGPWIKSLATSWPGSAIKGSDWAFPAIQIVHVLALSALGGAVLLPSLRLMNVGITTVSPATTEKTVRPLLWIALALLVFTGLLMSTVLGQRLYNRPAFFVKMVALAAALILSFGVVSPMAKNDGALNNTVRVLAGVALLLWAFAVFIFGTTMGAAPGLFHLVCAGALIVLAAGSRLSRIVLAAAVAVVCAALIATFFIYNPLDMRPEMMDVERWMLRLGGLVIAGLLAWDFLRPPADDKPKRDARFVGLLTILCWITVAAAGRWIGLGGDGG